MFLFATLWQQPFVEMFLNHPVLWADLTFFSTVIVRPRWTVEPTDKQFAQGSDAKIDCKADGFPQPKISWKKAVGKKFYFLFVHNFCIELYPIAPRILMEYWILEEFRYHLLVWQNSDQSKFLCSLHKDAINHTPKF